MATVTLPDTPLVAALRGLSVEQLEDELAELERQKAALTTHESLVRLALDWKRAVDAGNGNGAGSRVVRGSYRDSGRPRQIPSMGRPSTRHAILAVLAEREGVWTKDEILDRMEAHGWLPGGNARNQVTSRLGEMVSRQEVIRHSEGRYSLASSASGTRLGVEESAEAR